MGLRALSLLESQQRNGPFAGGIRFDLRACGELDGSAEEIRLSELGFVVVQPDQRLDGAVRTVGHDFDGAAVSQIFWLHSGESHRLLQSQASIDNQLGTRLW